MFILCSKFLRVFFFRSLGSGNSALMQQRPFQVTFAASSFPASGQNHSGLCKTGPEEENNSLKMHVHPKAIISTFDANLGMPSTNRVTMNVIIPKAFVQKPAENGFPAGPMDNSQRRRHHIRFSNPAYPAISSTISSISRLVRYFVSMILCLASNSSQRSVKSFMPSSSRVRKNTCRDRVV